MKLYWIYLFVSVIHLVLQDHLAADLATMVNNYINVCPCAELSLPVCNSGKRGNDKEGTSQTHKEDLIKERYGLDGFSQPHFIS